MSDIQRVISDSSTDLRTFADVLVADDVFLDNLTTRITEKVLGGEITTEVFTKEETIDDIDILSFID